MSKVTGKELEKLIEGALNEKYKFTPKAKDLAGKGKDILGDLEIEPRGKGAKDFLKNVGRLPKEASPTGTFTAADAVKAVTDDESKLKPVAATVAKKATGTRGKEFKDDYQAGLASQLGGVAPETAKDFAVKDDAKSIDIESFSFPRPLGDLSTSGKGKFLGSQNELLRNIFGASTLRERLEMIDLISEDLSGGEIDRLTRMDPRQILQYTMLADLFDLFLNQVDQRAGGYMFETFLANLAGGTVDGGDNGIADFHSGGSSGSAKLYASWAKITQSAKQLKKPGDSVHYVIGIHGAKQEERRTNIKLYYVVVTLKEIKENGTKTIIFTDGIGTKSVLNQQDVIKNGRIDISSFVKPSDVYVGEFDLAGPSGDYRKRLNDLIDAESDESRSKAGKAVKAMKGFFTHLYNAEENTKKYTAQKDAEDTKFGDAALEAYDAADAQLQVLLNILTPDKTVQGEKGDRKITKEHVLKLIEESFNK